MANIPALLGFLEYVLHPKYGWLQILGLVLLIAVLIGWYIYRRKQM